jgi:isovaleryl-CoA dehydrogenase
MGIFSGPVPVEYGGQGMGQVDTMIGYEQICKASMSVALAVGVTMGFGLRFIHELGTKEQKDTYLPLLAEGKFKTAMALTEPGGGTDILGALATFLKTRATRG